MLTVEKDLQAPSAPINLFSRKGGIGLGGAFEADERGKCPVAVCPTWLRLCFRPVRAIAVLGGVGESGVMPDVG